MPKYVIDVPSNRVIYFTTNDQESLVPGKEAVIYQDHFSPPSDMTIQNCWNYKLVGRTLIKQYDGETRTTKPTAVGENKQALIKLLTHQINAARSKLMKDFDFEPQVYLMAYNEAITTTGPQPYCEQLAKMKKINIVECRSFVIAEYQKFSRYLLNTDIWRRHYLEKIEASTTEEDQAVLRDEIGARNFEMDLF